MNQLLERAPRRTRRRVIAVAVASLMMVAACGSDDDESESGSGETTAAATAASSATTRSSGSATSATTRSTGTGAPATTGTAAPTTAANFPANADPDGRIRIATNLQIGGAQFNLDPFVASSPSYGGMYHLYLGTPLYVSREGTIEPYLAQSYEVRDAQTFVLTLRPGLTFQDGKPYDAAALKAALDEKIAGTLPAYKVGNETGIASITADTPTQLTIKTTGQTAGTMPLLMTEEFSLAVSRAPGNPIPIGAGPYRVTDFQSGLSVRMEKWDGFFRAADFGVKTLEYTNIPDRAAAINALNADQVDFVAASPLDADALTGTGRFEDVVTNTESYYFLRVCLTGPPFNDPTFRDAFAAALNRNRINTNVLGGLGEPMAGLWRSNSPFAYADADAIPADGDPGRAEQLVSELGDRPTVRILHFGVETHVRILEAVQAQMADVGIDVELSQFQFGVPSEQQFSAAQGGALMTTLTFSGVGKAMDAVPSLALSARVCPDAETPALTTAVNKLVAGALTPAETAATWQDVQREMVAISSIFPLVSQPVVYVYRNNIKGVVPGVVGLTSTTAPGPFLEGVYVEES